MPKLTTLKVIYVVFLDIRTICTTYFNTKIQIFNNISSARLKSAIKHLLSAVMQKLHLSAGHCWGYLVDKWGLL